VTAPRFEVHSPGTLLGDGKETCGRCGRQFDPTDRSWNGRARYRDWAFCRSCVDRCHESTDFMHSCVICNQAEGA
jgi:hypothetical protein